MPTSTSTSVDACVVGVVNDDGVMTSGVVVERVLEVLVSEDPEPEPLPSPLTPSSLPDTDNVVASVVETSDDDVEADDVARDDVVDIDDDDVASINSEPTPPMLPSSLPLPLPLSPEPESESDSAVMDVVAIAYGTVVVLAAGAADAVVANAVVCVVGDKEGDDVGVCVVDTDGDGVGASVGDTDGDGVG